MKPKRAGNRTSVGRWIQLPLRPIDQLVCYALSMPNSIVHFEIPADDVPRAKKFYEKALGWKISDPWKMNYFVVETKQKGEEGINGGLMQRKNPGQPFMNYISVDSIDASCKKVEKAGGVVALPKMEIARAWAGSRRSKILKAT